MSLRRGLALVMTFVASATVMAAVAAPQATAGPTSTPGKICVALVVDGRALGSDVSTACAKVAKGATGVDVLEAAGHTVGYRNDGLICTIDGLPKTGCAGIDASHYWAYFHRAPGRTTWTYSSEGASTYQPVNASTDGWVFDDGTALVPENVPYASICRPAQATPSPTPSRANSPTAKAATSAAAKAAPSTPAASSATPTLRARHPSAASAMPSTKPKVTSTPSSSKPSHPAKPPATPSPSATPTPSTSSLTLAGAETPASPSHGLRNLLIGLGFVALLAGLAFLRFRRPTP